MNNLETDSLLDKLSELRKDKEGLLPEVDLILLTPESKWNARFAARVEFVISELERANLYMCYVKMKLKNI
jgi:hypothetical protein